MTNRVPVVSRDDDVGNSVVAALQKMVEIAERWRFEIGEEIDDRIRQFAAEDEGLRCVCPSPLAGISSRVDAVLRVSSMRVVVEGCG